MNRETAMSTCLVTVRHADREWDLELPSGIPVAAVIRLLEEGLGLPPGLHLALEPFGAVLRDTETLDAAEVLDGARLLLTADPKPAATGSAVDAVGEGPALGWRPLTGDAGYAWKKLEE